MEAKTFLYFYCYCACLIMACHHFFVFLLLYRTLYCKTYFVSLSRDRTNYYVDEIWQCLAINVRWSPLVLNNAYYICIEWYSCLDEIWQCLAINVRWSPLVLNNAYYICMEWYSCLNEIWQCLAINVR